MDLPIGITTNERVLLFNEPVSFLDYLFGEYKHPIEEDEDYLELGLVFDEEV